MSNRGEVVDGGVWVDDQPTLDRYERLVESIGDGLYQLDAEGRFVAANDGLVGLTGHDREELLGEHVSRVFDEHALARIERDLRRTDDPGAALDVALEAADGSRIPCDLRVDPLLGDDERQGTVGVVRETEAAPESSFYESIAGVLDEADVGVFVLDESFDVAWINEATERYFGIDREAVLGRDKRSLIEEEIADRVDDGRQFLETVFATYDDNDYVERFDCRISASEDREERWLQHWSRPIEDGRFAAGRVELYYDVTEQKRAERSLAEYQRELERERNLFDRLLESTPVGTMVLDDDGEMLRINDRARELLDVPESAVESYSPADRRTFDEDGDPVPVEDHPFARVLEAGEPVYDEVLQVEQRDGSRRWLSVDAVPLFDDEGEVDLVVTTGEDVTHLKERERSLSTELDEVHGRVSDAFAALDEELQFVRVNDQAQALLGLSADELVGEYVDDVIPEVEDSELLGQFREAIETGEPVTVDRYADPLGRCFEIRAFPSEPGLSVYFRDVTDRVERERELEEYRALTQAASDVIVTIDEESTVRTVNPAVEDVFGYEPDELEGESLTTLMPDDLAEDLRGALQRYVETGVRNLEWDYLELPGEHADGHELPLAVSFDEVVHDGERFFTGIVRDVTERTEMERELRESEERFRSLAENLEEVVWMSTPEKDEMLYVNPAYEEVWGRSQDSLYEDPTSFVDAIHPEDRERVRTALPDQVDGDYEETYRIVRSDGEVRWVRDRAVPVEDDDGEVHRIVGIAEDVTERREYEQKLEERERQLTTLMDNVPGMVYRCANDHGWPMEFVSDACHEITGYDPDRLEAGEVSFGEDVVLEADRDDLWEEIQSNVTDREPFATTYRIETADGDLRWVRDHGRGVFDDDGELVALEGIVQDVTERRRLESELEEHLSRITDAFYALDDQWRFTYVNERAEELIDYRGEGLEGENVWEVFEWAADSRIREEYGTAMETQEATSFEVHYPEPLDAWYELNAYPSETGLSVYFRDVTDRVERERELELFRNLLDHSNDAVFVEDPETGRILDANDTAARTLGYDREELLELTVPEIDTELPTLEDYREFVDELRSKGTLTFDGLQQRKDGTTYPVEINASYVDLDREYVLAVARDVTERRRRERRLEESERRHRTLAECFPNGIVTLFDEDLEYELAAGQGFEKVSADPSELEGRHYREIWGDEAADELEPAFEGALDGEEEVVELEYEGREWVLHSVPITDERGEVFAGMTMAQDITERKERERTLRSLTESVQRLLGAEASTDVSQVVVDAASDMLGLPCVAFYRHDEETGELVPDAGSVTEEFPGQEFQGLPVDGDSLLARTYRDGSPHRYKMADERTNVRVTSTNEEMGSGLYVPVGDYGIVVAGSGGSGEIDDQHRQFVELLATNARVAYDRVEREQYLRDAKERLEAATEAGAVGTFEWRIQEDQMITGESFARLFGVDPGAAGEGVSLDQFVEGIHPKDRDRIEAAIEEAVETCGEYREEYRVQTADDDLRWVVARGHVECDEDGEPVRFPGALTDVTERRSYRRRLEQSERRYRTLVENFPEGAVGLYDEDLEYTVVGGQLLEEVGVDPEERVGNSVYELYPDDIVEEVAPHFEAALDGETNEFEVEYYDRHLHAYTLPVRDADDEVFAGMLVVQDVTERREYERRLEASNERLEQFAYAASHDLQEPLRMVSSYLSLIERRYEDDLDEDGREFLEFAVDGADRMREMIDGLLEYSRVESRGDSLEPVDLEDVVDGTLENLRMRIEESNAEVTVEPLPTVRGDASQLRQVFQNLLENAIDYSGDDPPEIVLSADWGSETCTVTVKDDGIGIDPEHADRVFEVFQRLHTHDEYAGTGIGLALCRRIVERHDGEIWVDSEPGTGATFSFTLPVEVSHDD